MKILYILFVVGLSLGADGAEDELDAVVVIYRHGDRTPVKPYSTDPYRNNSYWPVDFGQLTNKGKQQHLALGKWLRNRYQRFLSSAYSEKDIYVRSTDVDRTLMSAEANLAGLYPPASNQVWDQNIKWQPIPIHTIPEHDDALLAAKKNCPKYDRLYRQLFKTDFFRNVTHQNHDLYAYLSRYTGDRVTNLELAEYLYNTLMIETLYNFTLPNWTVSVFPEKLQPLAFLSFATQTYTSELARLKVGPLFNEIVTFFRNHTGKRPEGPRLLVFSGHDTTIANVLNTMGAFQYHAPPYASTIIFELKRRSNGRNYVNIFYKNSTEPRPIRLKACDINCDLADFVAILKPIIVTLEEWKIECNLKWTHAITLIYYISILVSLVLAILIPAIWVACKLKKRQMEVDSNKYTQLPNEEYA